MRADTPRLVFAHMLHARCSVPPPASKAQHGLPLPGEPCASVIWQQQQQEQGLQEQQQMQLQDRGDTCSCSGRKLPQQQQSSPSMAPAAAVVEP